MRPRRSDLLSQNQAGLSVLRAQEIWWSSADGLKPPVALQRFPPRVSSFHRYPPIVFCEARQAAQ
jgi:hypothetical protein